jgi:hypothetical protein
MQLRDFANERRRFGYRRLFVLLRQEGEPSHQTHLPALLLRRRLHGSQATGPEARGRDAVADPGRIQAERSLISGFRP